jgi:uncharacterized repeat protein (TIGR01451 family)
VNNATVTVNGISEWDTFTIDILHPRISIVKNANVTMAHVGETVKYTYNVTNTGDVPFPNGTISIIDNLTIPVIYVSGDDGNSILDPDEYWIYEAYYTVLDGTPDPLVNNATVTVNGISEWDTFTIDILHPAIEVIKSANATLINAGDWVRYNVTVVNTGDCNLTVTLSDSKLGISWSGTLKPGEQHEFIVDYQPSTDPTVNTATATGTDALGGTVSDIASWTVHIWISPQEITISGYKFHDRNGNGIWESGEEGLAGWVIQLLRRQDTNWSLVYSTVTGGDGSYSFTVSQTGRYRIVEVPRDGWIQTAPPNGFYEFDLTGSVDNKNFGNRLAPVGGELLPIDLSAHLLNIVALVALASALSLIVAFKKSFKIT